MKTVFYIGHINYIGGVEQWIYYIAKKYSKNHNIELVYKWSAIEQLLRLKRMIKCSKYNNEQIECDTFIYCYDHSILNNVKAKNYILTIHADYKEQGINITIPRQTTHVYCVSELARKSFVETHGEQLKALGLEAKVLYNPIDIDEPKKVLKLISATRLTKEKGGKRMQEMAKTLNELQIPFTWLVFTNSPGTSGDGFVYMKPRLDIMGFIKEADYLVQLSDTEGFAYSIVEALTVGTPVIVTDFPVGTEMGIKDGVNGHILKMDLSNLNEVISKLDKNLKGFTYTPKETQAEWLSILGKPTKNNYKGNDKVEIQAKQSYDDLQLGKLVNKGDIYTVNEKRALQLVNVGYAEIIN